MDLRTDVKTLFFEASYRFYLNFIAIKTFNDLASYGVPGAAQTFVSSTVNETKRDMSDQLRQAEREGENVDVLTKTVTDWLVEVNTGLAHNLTTAATLVFAHAVLDALAVDLCRVMMRATPSDWEAEIENKQLAWKDVRDKSIAQIRLECEEKKHKDYDQGKSLAQVLDVLFDHSGRPEPKDFYDRDRVDRLDKVRQAIMHTTGVAGTDLSEIEGDLEYLLHLAHYCIQAVGAKCGFAVNQSDVHDYMKQTLFRTPP